MFNKRTINTTINITSQQQHVEVMSEIQKKSEMRTCRPAMISGESQCFNIAATWINKAGLEIHFDNVGNLFQRFKRNNPYLAF